MISLDRDKLRHMYPPMSAEFERQMRQLIRTLPAQRKETKMKRHSLKLMIAALLVFLLLSASAYAMTRPAILDWLLGKGSPASVLLTNAAQEIQVQSSADGVTVRLTGAVCDGEELVLSYEINNAEPSTPVLVAVDDMITLNGEAAHLLYATVEEPRMIPSPHLDVPPVQRNPLMGGAECYGLPDGLDGEVHCSMTFRIYRAAKGFAVTENVLAQMDNPDMQDVLDTLRSFDNTVIAGENQLDPAIWAEAGYVAIDHTGTPQLGLEAEVAAGRLVETDCVPVEFGLYVRAQVYDFSDTADVMLEEGTLRVERFRLTPLSTEVQIFLLPGENTRQAAQEMADLHGRAILTEASGHVLTYSDMDWLSSVQPHVICWDGQWLCEYHIDMPGLLAFPERIAFATEAGRLRSFDLQTAE